MDLSMTVAGPATTNVIAYVVSGVGFLGAGAIMKEGGSIRGLNTAATLWCSAAVGACAGAGELLDAVFVTALLVGINLLLRPVSRYIDKHSLARVRSAVLYRISIMCPPGAEQEVRALLVRAVAERPMSLRELRTEDSGDGDETFIEAVVEVSKREKAQLEALIAELKRGSEVSSVEWAETASESD